jgi:hypothetical protein
MRQEKTISLSFSSRIIQHWPCCVCWVRVIWLCVHPYHKPRSVLSVGHTTCTKKQSSYLLDLLYSRKTLQVRSSSKVGYCSWSSLICQAAFVQVKLQHPLWPLLQCDFENIFESTYIVFFSAILWLCKIWIPLQNFICKLVTVNSMICSLQLNLITTIFTNINYFFYILVGIPP